jgi:NAD(P)-dependent dehydrogenase (short-subunit alcohol dehydrogenase family)
MSKRLSGKVCIITGTGGGMGREAALTFAREGALVVGCDLQVDAAQATVEAVRAAVGAIADVKRRSFYHPCFARRLGGVSGGRETQGWRDSSHTPMVGAGKFGSAKLPMATATYPGKPSPSQ